MNKEKQSEINRKRQALEGKSYLLENEENDGRRKPSQTEGSEFIERDPNNQDVNDQGSEKMDYNKAKG